MWTAVASRRHTVYQIYPFGGGSDQFMLHGVVTLGLRTGATVDVEWAGRAEMARPSGDGKWRMKRYQVYLVSMTSLSLLSYLARPGIPGAPHCVVSGAAAEC